MSHAFSEIGQLSNITCILLVKEFIFSYEDDGYVDRVLVSDEMVCHESIHIHKAYFNFFY